ncbi:hypothetical protein ARMSODRAFT_162878 [Armillaria solidipes]|uniref:Uncharacterized protein n=1 Tax=Armillaria solidipes TaxID=1076256 RepID=A0A2H3BR34_9AGAR|nr:hypothetical protein ARMSODRAFT_162878 [Armillaria solidipes]
MYTWDHVHMEIEPSRMRTVFLDHYRFARIWPQQTHTKLMVVGVRPVPARGSRNCDFVRICAFLLSMMLKKGNSMNETRSSSYNWCMYAPLLRYCQSIPTQQPPFAATCLSVVLTFSSNLFASWKPPQRSLWFLTVQPLLLTSTPISWWSSSTKHKTGIIGYHRLTSTASSSSSRSRSGPWKSRSAS